MANRFLVAGGSGLWNNTNNWASTSGGASGASFPVAGDVVAFDGNSGNAPMTVNVASACASLAMSGGYAGTLTYSSTLTLTSTYTQNATCTIAGTAGTLILNGTATITSAGKTLTCGLTLGTGTFTLADNWAVNGLVTAAVSTINGASFKITCAGGLHVTGTMPSGTAKLELTGGTWDSVAGTVGTNLDLAGNVTVSGAVAWGTAGKTLTYVSGTITTTGSTLTIATASTLNTAGMTWASVTLAGAITCTLSSTLAAATLTLPNAACTFAGTAGFTAGTLTTATLSASRTCTLTFGNTYTVTTALTNVGTTATVRQAIVSSSAGNKVVFTLTPGASCNLRYCDPTDVDSSAGATVLSIDGTITTSLNWSSSYVTPTGPGGGRVLSSSIIQGQGA